MAAPNQAPGSVAQTLFSAGMQSHVDPVNIGENAYRLSYNMLNRGGFMSTRPGYRWVSTFGPGPAEGVASVAQGLCHFKTLGGEDFLLTAVDGAVYVARYPFNDFTALPVRMREDAPEVFFAVCEQSTTFDKDTGITKVLERPKRVVVIQDGLSAPVVWDGATASKDFDIPQGSCMAWSGNRLWVASGAELYASDIGDPTSFQETGYLGIGGAFLLPMSITAMTEVGAAGNLLVWTSGATYTVMSNLRDRSQWTSTSDFLSVLSPTIGCVGQRAVTSQFGNIWWMTRDGLTALDSTAAARITSKLNLLDAEMAVSKERLPRDLSGVALGWFGNCLMASVPFGGQRNSHTWVMDGTPMSTITANASEPAWASVWTGTNPAAWATGLIGGGTRCYHLSSDEDGRCSIWEAFSDLEDDSGVPISWAFESRGYGIDGFSQFNVTAADVRFGKVRGALDVAAFLAPSQHGSYSRILTHRISADVAPIDLATTFSTDSLDPLKTAAGQFRQLRSASPRGSFTLACDPQAFDKQLGRDCSFSLLLCGVGKCNFTGLRLITLPESENANGRCLDPVGEELRALPDGTASAGAWPSLDFSFPLFVSTKTAPGLGGQPAVASTASSPVSQLAADRIAEETAKALAMQRYLAKVTVHAPPATSLL